MKGQRKTDSIRIRRPFTNSSIVHGWLLLLDEPTPGLAPLVIAQIFDIIRTIRDEGVTVFLVEQNANKALGVADRGYVLETGRVVLADTGANLLANDRITQAYLGG